MTAVTTILALAGVKLAPPPLREATLVLIDYQNEYLSGPLALTGAQEAIARTVSLLDAVRRAGGRVVHVAHRGAAGSLFDRNAPRGEIIEALQPHAGEPVVEKTRANAFSGTELAGIIGPAGTPIIVAGFMTHNCVSSTVRAAYDLGYSITVAGDACATRDLPSGNGVIAARDLHRAELAGLGDTQALVTDVAQLLAA